MMRREGRVGQGQSGLESGTGSGGRRAAGSGWSVGQDEGTHTGCSRPRHSALAAAASPTAM